MSLTASVVTLSVALGSAGVQAQPTVAQNEALPLSAPQIASIDSVFSQYDHTWSPGCALGIVRNGQLAFSRGYGMANLEHNIALTDRSVFRIGSVSKQFTAAAVALLAQDGVLSLDDDVRRFMPELPVYGRPITIRHFLHHTSGIRDYIVLMYLAGYRGDDWYTDQDVVNMLARQKELNFLPGDEFLYSNAGYFLLSQIVQRASSNTLREFAAAHIFAPLDMTDSHFHDDHNHVVPGRASGYAPDTDGQFRISMTTLDMVGDGGVYTTVQDLVKWDRNFYEARVGGSTFLADMHARAVLNNGDTLVYALGNNITEYRGLPTVVHGGSWVGFRAQLTRFPTERTSVICLCNVASANPNELTRGVVDVILAGRLQPVEDPVASNTGNPNDGQTETPLLPAGSVHEYVGRYYAEELDAVYEIKRDGDSLAVTVGNTIDGPLQYLGDDKFDRNNLVFRFERGAGGVTGFRLDAGRVKNVRFVRWMSRDR